MTSGSSCSTSGRRAARAWAYINFDWVAGLLWFLGKTFGLVFLFVWMRGTLPRVRDRPADGLRLEVAPARVAAEPVRDRGRDRGPRRLRKAGLLEPLQLARAGLRHRQGHGADAPAVLRAQGHGHVPGDAARTSRRAPRPSPAALRRVRRPQVRDLLPVRPGLPDRVHRHGRDGHQGPLPRPLGPARDVRRATRGIGPASIRRPCRTRPTSTSRVRPGPRSTRSSRPTTTTRRTCSRILEATQAAFGYLPVAAIKRISERTGAWYAMVYGTATFYGHLRFEPSDGEVGARSGVAARRPTTGYG